MKEQGLSIIDIQETLSVKDDAFVFFKGADSRVGRVVGISRQGIEFEYMAGDDWPSEPVEVDLYVSGYGYHIEKLPTRTVYDRCVEKGSPFSTVRVRRRGMQFGALTPHQESMLEGFIRLQDPDAV